MKKMITYRTSGNIETKIKRGQIQSNDIVIYEDAALSGLRIQLIALEHKIYTLEAIRDDYLRRINAFNEEHNKRLGGIIKELNKLREERVFKPLAHDNSHKDAHKDTKDNSESFKREDKELVRELLAKLSEQDREEIKKIYRQAGRLCHPDVVEESKKQQAKKIFQSLSTEYKKGNMTAVKKIFESLQSGECFADYSDVINDKVLLGRKINNLKEAIIRLEVEIEKVKNEKITIRISNISDMNEYFDCKKEELIAQINLLLIRSAIGDSERISI